MGTGYLKIQADTADGALPVAGAHVVIRDTKGNILYETETDANGSTKKFPLPAPPKELSLDKNYNRPAYSVYDVDVMAPGFVSKHIHSVEILDTQTSILPVHMEPLVDEYNPVTDEDIHITPNALVTPHQFAQRGTSVSPFVLKEVVIPDYITVHLGAFNDASAQNVRVKFPEYVANVATSEIYSTWPYNSLVANVHVITTFAINRIFTEWYRVRNFNFDITSSTQTDQKYRHGAAIAENLLKIADQMFNVYARRFGFLDPFFTEFCDGKIATCPGLTQWGTVTLANQGLTPLQILHHFYPKDLELATSNNITSITESFPGTALTVGSSGDAVRRMQVFLNRIRVNYPLIPTISNPNGVFGSDTADAVRTFQRTFSLTADGIIGRATWNKISFIYIGITKLSELTSEGIRHSIGQNPPTVTIRLNDRGPYVLELQFILNAIGPYYDTIPIVIQDGSFGAGTKNAVIAFQKTFNLTQDGVVGIGTWNKLYAVYRGIYDNVVVPPTPAPPPSSAPPFPGTALRVGSTGSNVRLMQTYLNTIRIVYPSIPYSIVDGIFGSGMEQSVIAFQRQFWLTPDGIIGATTWNKIVEIFQLVTGGASVSLEFPGTPLKLGSRGTDVRLMQGYLSELRSAYPSLPAVTVDGIFGANTEAAVISFQRIMGLTADGIIGPTTWYAIINQRNAIT